MTGEPAAGSEPLPAAAVPQPFASRGYIPVPVAPAKGELCLIRHGETEWSRTGRHTGTTDIPLTAYGEKQAIALRSLLAFVKPVLLLTSPRQRAVRTAELAGLDKVAPVEVDADLAEWDYGDYEGVTTPEIRRTDPDWTVWSGRTPNGETPEDVRVRADRVLDRCRDALAAGPVIAIGHGHMSRVLAARWLELPVTSGRLFTLGPASPCLLGHEHGTPAIHRWNVPNPAERDPG
jgi:broad specificity phosphatase PhoE